MVSKMTQYLPSGAHVRCTQRQARPQPGLVDAGVEMIFDVKPDLVMRLRRRLVHRRTTKAILYFAAEKGMERPYF